MQHDYSRTWSCALQGATVRCKAVKALKAVVQASRSVLALDEVQDGVSLALQVNYNAAIATGMTGGLHFWFVG
jgi:hypothetical protein